VRRSEGPKVRYHVRVSLATVRVGSPAASKSIVMLHGIYGRGRNWQAVAKGLVAARPDVACLLVDLPHHGDSAAGTHGDTVRGVAADLANWFDASDVRPDAILGHSFGGKVALALADAWRNRPLQVWIVESTPDSRSPSGSAWDLLQAVRRLPSTFPSREDLISALTTTGWATGVAQWMATNLTREGDVFAWRIDFDAMERLLLDFFSTDLWPAVDAPAAGHILHFIKATDSSVMSEDAVRRAGAAGVGRVHVHHLQGGHWIHAEQPGAIIALLAEAL
jgi:esterase